MSFSVEFPIRFGEIDHARVVYYPRFFHLFHQTFEEWFRQALGRSYPELVMVENIGFPSVRVEAEFFKPLRYGDTARVELELLNIGTKSITCGYTVTRLPDGERAARAVIKTVAIDNDTFCSVAIPARWRERFEEFQRKAAG